MLCGRCADLRQARRTWVRASWSRAAPSDPRWHGVLCTGCGAVLPAQDTSERLLHKLSQLAQFGLVGAGVPLLRAAPQAIKDG